MPRLLRTVTCADKSTETVLRSFSENSLSLACALFRSCFCEAPPSPPVGTCKIEMPHSPNSLPATLYLGRLQHLGHPESRLILCGALWESELQSEL